MKTYAIILACIFALCASSALATDLYVDPVSGDDANDGLSWEAALKTITRASQLENSPGTIFLGAGVFNVEVGETFPVTFNQATEIRGAGPEKTFIAVGDPPETIIWKGWEQPTATMSSVAFCSTLLGNTYYSRNSFVINIEADWNSDDIFCLERVRFVGFVSQFAELHIIDRGFGGTRLERCEFLNCRANMIHEAGRVSISDCLFQPTQSAYIADPDLVLCGCFDLSMNNCVFKGTPEQPSFDISEGSGHTPAATIINCVFEDIDFVYDSPTYVDAPFVGGCTFRNSNFSYSGGWGHYNVPLSVLAACIFDSDSYIDIDTASVLAEYCSIANEPILHWTAYFDEYYPLVSSGANFARGPLGDSYLSNLNSGQFGTSQCIDSLGEYYSSNWTRYYLSAWPPSGSTTRTDGVPDEAPYDIGYHYPSVPPPPPAVDVRTDRSGYAVGEEMTFYPSYENRGGKVEGAIYFAFAPEGLEWLIYWPWMTFIPTPYVEGTLYSGISYPNLPSTTHTIPEGLAPGTYYWLGAVIASDGSFASDIAIWPVEINGEGPRK